MTVINGTDNSEVLTGDVNGIPADDVISGQGGDDQLHGGAGNDR